MKLTKRDKEWFKEIAEYIGEVMDMEKDGEKYAIKMLQEVFDNGYSLGYNTAQGEFAKELKKKKR